MDAQNKFLAKEKLADWLKELSSRFEVWAPKNTGSAASGAVIYAPYDPDEGIELKKKPTESAKRTIFPQSEALFNFKKQQEGGKPSVELEVPEDPAPRLVFGLLPCDARGFLIFDPVYAGSGTDGQAKDVYYLKRRQAVVLVTLACKSVFSTCFCNWVGGSPSSSEGSDVLATEVEGGYLLAPVTERGAAVLDSALLKNADEAQAKKAGEAHDAAAALLKEAPDVSGAPEALWKLFDDAGFWERESAHCLSCGACTYLCPTCYCFNITDEGRGHAGVRLRSWDACMMPLFTAEASGHNPRTAKAGRLKNRIGHKFSYYPKLHAGRISCVGCGRCIKSCPSAVDIRRVVTDSVGITTAPAAKEQKDG